VPAHEGIRLHNRESACPGKESALYQQGELRGGSWPPPARLALQVESQLPPEKQILSDHRSSGTKKHSDQVAPNGERHGEGPNHWALLLGQRGCRSMSNTLLQRPPSHVFNFSGAQPSSQSGQVPKVPPSTRRSAACTSRNRSDWRSRLSIAISRSVACWIRSSSSALVACEKTGRQRKTR
jgi:hypothetical protein